MEEDVNLKATINSKTHSIDIKSGEKYKYWQDTMSGSLESNKIPVYLADTVVFSTVNKSVTISSTYFNLWTHNRNNDNNTCIHTLVIDEALFENQ